MQMLTSQRLIRTLRKTDLVRFSKGGGLLVTVLSQLNKQHVVAGRKSQRGNRQALLTIWCVRSLNDLRLIKSSTLQRLCESQETRILMSFNQAIYLCN